MNNQPDITGNNRDEQGKFTPGVSGNPAGRPKGSPSITAMIKQKLEEAPDGQEKSYLELLVQQILDKAILNGDYQMVKQIWDHIDGRPKESFEIGGKIQPVPITGMQIVFDNVFDRVNDLGKTT